ncbi:MAG: DsbC family protein [Nitrospiraceae bacterium]|nr:DsbC family protein [Nitrospiraceae bacterium]
MKKYAVPPCLLAVLLSLFAFSATVYAFGGCEEDCQKCHSLEKNEVRQILTKLRADDADVLDIKMSPVRGLWEVTVDEKGKKGVLYVGFSKKYVMPGPIFAVDTAENKTQESLSAANRPADRYIDVSKIPLDDALVMGDRNAPKRVIVFTDPDCPYCAKLHAELKKVVTERRDISFYLKLMPLPFHPDSHWKSESIVCAKSLEMLDLNFSKKPVPKPSCTTKVVDETIRVGKELGITGTPTLIMPDGLVVFGTRDAKTIERLVSESGKKG